MRKGSLKALCGLKTFFGMDIQVHVNAPIVGLGQEVGNDVWFDH